MSFIVYGLPRSRTTWLSRFLTYGDWHCGHDEARNVRSMDDVKSWFAQPNTGTVETAAAPFWRTVQALQPDVRVVVIRRPIAEVVESLMQHGPFERERTTAFLQRADRKLEQIARRVPGVLSVSFADLKTEAACARIFEHCLPYKHDPKWWASWDAINVQVNLTTVLRHYQAHEPQLQKMAAQSRILTLAEFDRKRPRRDPDDLVIAEEDFETFYRDATRLFETHLTLIGDAPNWFENINIPLIRKLEQAGSLHIMTARSNGRMFGYLITIVGQSIESADKITAVPIPFYASPEFPGLGRQLQRASQAVLRERGATEMIFRAGTRGDGPRMGAIFRRMGAEDFGQLYRLQF